jgi:hypothetical protein
MCEAYRDGVTCLTVMCGPCRTEVERIKRQAYLAYLFLNIVDCPRCHLPSARGYICPCGYDGTPESLAEKIDREFR